MSSKSAICLILLFCLCLIDYVRAKTVVVYYSYSGNTEIVAKQLSESLSSDIAKIEIVSPYPGNVKKMVSRCKSEVESKNYPELKDSGIDFSRYDTVFVGYPIWFGTFANPIYSFLRANSMSGKLIYTFATYENGGLEKSTNDIKKICPDSKVFEGFGVSEQQLKDSVSLRIILGKINSCLSMIGVQSNSSRNQDDLLCGAYMKQDSISEDALAAFNEAMSSYPDLKLVPFKVYTQVVAGINYKFKCTQEGDSARQYEIIVFRPLPGRGNPVLKGILIESPDEK